MKFDLNILLNTRSVCPIAISRMEMLLKSMSCCKSILRHRDFSLWPQTWRPSGKMIPPPGRRGHQPRLSHSCGTPFLSRSGLSINDGVLLYKQPLRPVMDYARPMWRTAARDHVQKIKFLQSFFSLRLMRVDTLVTGKYKRICGSVLRRLRQSTDRELRHEVS